MVSNNFHSRGPTTARIDEMSMRRTAPLLSSQEQVVGREAVEGVGMGIRIGDRCTTACTAGLQGLVLAVAAGRVSHVIV